jgi:chromate reductase
MKVLTFGASLRKDSFNKQLIRLAVTIMQSFNDVEINHIDFADFRMPVYDGDLEVSEGLPEGTQKLAQAIHAADALIISAPEHNASISGPFKNAIDWISRDKSNPLDKKFLLLLAASPGVLGGVRCFPHVKVTFEELGTYVYPKVFALPKAHEAFEMDDKLKDVATQERLQGLLKEYIGFVQTYLKN